MRYWFDTEFHDHGRTIDLISLGIVAEDGREWYVINSDYDPKIANEWLTLNVIPQLTNPSVTACSTYLSHSAIRDGLLDFIGQDNEPEFWAYFGEYDWIVLRQLFGSLTDWPNGWPLMHFDIEQARLHLKALAFESQSDYTHHALADARWTRDSFMRLNHSF